MQFDDFSKEFIERSKINCVLYKDSKGEYEVTNLISCCLGMIILPNQIYADKLSNENIYETYGRYNINKDKNRIKDYFAHKHHVKYGLKNIVRHIRNGLSHGYIKTNVNENPEKKEKIHSIEIEDYHEGNLNFSIQFTVEEFENFAFAVADDFIEIIEA